MKTNSEQNSLISIFCVSLFNLFESAVRPCYNITPFQGQVTNMKGEPLPDVKIFLDNHPLHVIHPGARFLSILPIGTYRLSFALENFEPKSVTVEVKAGEMSRKTVVLESSIGVELKYHTDRQIGTFMQQLVTNYPGKAR